MLINLLLRVGVSYIQIHHLVLEPGVVCSISSNHVEGTWIALDMGFYFETLVLCSSLQLELTMQEEDNLGFLF